MVVFKPFLRQHLPKLFSPYIHSSLLRGAPRTRNYAVFSDRDGNSIHLASVSDGVDSENNTGGINKDHSILVTNSYKVESGAYGKKNVETESTEDIIGSNERGEYR